MEKKQATSSLKLLPRLKKKYQEVVPALQKQLDYTSPMQVPRLLAIHINQGIAEAKNNTKILETAIQELTAITGQRAKPTATQKDISNFKLRQGMKIGVRVTLRGNKMYEFLDRLITFALPREKDFRGVKKQSFDGCGNYTYGVREQIIFPEISIDKVDKIRGMNVTFVTSAKNDSEGYILLKALGMPFAKEPTV